MGWADSGAIDGFLSAAGFRRLQTVHNEFTTRDGSGVGQLAEARGRIHQNNSLGKISPQHVRECSMRGERRRRKESLPGELER